jgi:hypothetical protein
MSRQDDAHEAAMWRLARQQGYISDAIAQALDFAVGNRAHDETEEKPVVDFPVEPPRPVLEAICKHMTWPIETCEQDARDLYDCVVRGLEQYKVSDKSAN